MNTQVEKLLWTLLDFLFDSVFQGGPAHARFSAVEMLLSPVLTLAEAFGDLPETKLFFSNLGRSIAERGKRV